MTGKIRFRIIFSKIFENNESRLIGLYDFGKSGGFLGLRIMMITENFHRKVRGPQHRIIYVR